MSKNNPVGNIPISTPILRKMNIEIMRIYTGLSEQEKKHLQYEIQSVTETNCDYMIYDIAQLMKDYVKTSLEGI